MKTTVSLETAKQLAEAGFLPPEVAMDGQFWFDGDNCLYVIHCTEPPFVHGVFIGDDHAGFCEEQNEYELFAPTATDILAQMPEGTRLVKHGTGWVCAWDLDYVGASVDNREDECPHECAAKAFLAWKAGLE